MNGVLVGGSDKLSAKVSDGSFSELLTASSSQQPAALPRQLQQALQEAAAAKPSGSQARGPQVPAELQQLVSRLTDPEAGVPGSHQPGQLPAHAFTGKALVDWLTQHSSSSSTGSSGSAQGGRAAAIKTAGQLLAANVITVVSQQQPAAAGLVFRDEPGAVYRLRAEAPRDLAWGTPLNTGTIYIIHYTADTRQPCKPSLWMMHFCAYTTPCSLLHHCKCGITNACAPPLLCSTGYWWGPAPARPAEVVAEELRARMLSLYERHLSADGKAVAYKALKRDPDFWEYVDATAELQRVRGQGRAQPGCHMPA